MNYLSDTCVISELVAKQPNPQVCAIEVDINRAEEAHLYLSVITIGEIRKGEKLAQSRRKTTLE